MTKKKQFTNSVKKVLSNTKKKIISIDKKAYKFKDKIEKKIEKTKYIGNTAKKIFNINRRFDASFPRIGKTLDYAVLVPEPGTMSVSVAAKTIGGGALMAKDYLKRKKK